MKRLLAIVLLWASLCATATAQPSGGEVLQQMSAKLAAMGSYRIDYALEMPTAEQASVGYLIVSDGGRFVIDIDGLKQGSDGEVVWVVNPLNKEISLDTPLPESRNLFDNPTKAFDFAADLFEVEYTEATAEDNWRIVLLPKEGVLEGVERVVVEIDRKTLLPTRLGYDMAGVGLWITIKSIEPYTPAAHDFEAPTQQRFPDYEMIDFR
ncbi:MAG: outer membrane lipoprotein carrier protein LolA [Tidjanibacter sp.]|nr:outer membrane lipoprotein carrier protein LolA [Tidjanibacter sp.]